MTDASLQFDELSEQNLQLLQAYALRAKTARATSAEFDGWLGRVCTLPGLTTESLVRGHGELIAQGFLKFEITGRSVGLRYQISPRGKQAMDRASLVNATDENGALDTTIEAA